MNVVELNVVRQFDFDCERCIDSFKHIFLSAILHVLFRASVAKSRGSSVEGSKSRVEGKKVEGRG